MRTIGEITTFVCLVAILAACGKGGASKATANLSNIASALNPPTAGGTATRWELDSAGIPHRVTEASRAGCETIQASKLYRFFLAFPRLSVCLYGALEKRNIISQPATPGEYNYYAFNSSRAASTLRYGKDGKGNLSINLCQAGDAANRAEIYVANATDTSTLMLTSVNTAPGASANSTMQFVITALINAEGSANPYEFQKASGVLGGDATASAASSFYIEKGTDRNILKESYALGTFTRKLYSEWVTGSQGSSKAMLPSVASGAAFVDSWKDDTTFACIEPRTTGTFYSTVNAFDLATLGSPTTPTFQNSWTCSDLGGKTLTTVVLPQDQSLVNDLTACFNGIGLDDSLFLQNCGSATVCSSR